MPPNRLRGRDDRSTPAVHGSAGGLGPARGDDAAYGVGQLSPQAAQELVSALKEIRMTIAAGESFAEILPVRSRQLDFLKAQGRFPDFIDVGADVWYAVHDWHVRLQQPLVLGMMPRAATR